MLVDECGAGGAVAYALHQFPQAGTGRTGQGVAGMAQIMEVDAGQVGADQEDGTSLDSAPSGSGCRLPDTLVA